jgi:uncharacterized membrane protein
MPRPSARAAADGRLHLRDLAVVTLSAERFRRPVELALLARLNAWVGPRIFTPASLAALASGLLLVADGPWTLGELRIVLGLVGFALTFLPGYLFLSPEAKRIRDALEREGPGGPEVARRVRRVLFVSRATTVLLVFVVADMVLKPSAGDGRLLAGGAAVLAAATAGLLLLGRTTHRPEAPETPAPAPR